MVVRSDTFFRSALVASGLNLPIVLVSLHASPHRCHAVLSMLIGSPAWQHCWNRGVSCMFVLG